VDSEGKLIFNSLVKPDKPVLDFLTRYSGITEKKLEGVTTRLIDVQKKLCELVDENTILLGHSLECDLKVLKVSGPYHAIMHLEVDLFTLECSLFLKSIKSLHIHT
jgi:RNA exonuclease 1